MTTDRFESLSLKELLEFEQRLLRVIAVAKAREREAVRQKLAVIIDNSGLEIEEIADLIGLGSLLRGNGKVPPKYRNPENRLETWTGRGRQPRWLSARLSKGAKLADFVI